MACTRGEGARSPRGSPREASVRGHSPTRTRHEATESRGGAPVASRRCAEQAAVQKARGWGRQPNAASTQNPRLAELGSPPPASFPPSLRFSVVAAVTDKCDMGRRELPLSQAASASASPSLAHSRGRRRIYLQGGRASAGEQKRRAQCAESAGTKPAPARARAGDAATAREGGGGAAATRCRGRARGRARGSGGRRRLCRAGVTEVKYMLTMGSPGSLGRAVGLPPGLDLSHSGWTSSWFPNDAFPGRLLSAGPSALQ